MSIFDGCELVAEGGIEQHSMTVLECNNDCQDRVFDEISRRVADHYLSPNHRADLLRLLGHAEAAQYLLEKLPITATARSGDLGEILATEYIDEHTTYRTPIKRLRWKDHRDMAMRGDDVIAISFPSDDGAVQFLKGEVKSRQALSAAAIGDARGALDGCGGKPSPHALSFIVERLREIGDVALFERLLRSVISETMSTTQVQHMMFVMSGNNSSRYLEEDMGTYAGGITQRYVGLVIPGHQRFIAEVFARVEV